MFVSRRFQSMGGDAICAICHEGLQRSTRMVVTMPCTHVYHWTCLTRWAKRSSTCPECRAQLERLDEDVDCQYLGSPREVLARFGRGLLLQHRAEQAQNPFDPPRPRNADDATLREQANTPNYIMDEPAPAAPPANSQTRGRVLLSRPEGIDWSHLSPSRRTIIESTEDGEMMLLRHGRGAADGENGLGREDGAGGESPGQRIGSVAETFGTVLGSMTNVVLAAAGAGAAARGSPQISQSETTYLQHPWQQMRANACGPQELPPQPAEEGDDDVVVGGDGDGWARVEQERALESHGAPADVYEGAGWEPVDVGRAPVFDDGFDFAAPTQPLRPSRVCLSLADLTQADDLD